MQIDGEEGFLGGEYSEQAIQRELKDRDGKLVLKDEEDREKEREMEHMARETQTTVIHGVINRGNNEGREHEIGREQANNGMDREADKVIELKNSINREYNEDREHEMPREQANNDMGREKTRLIVVKNGIDREYSDVREREIDREHEEIREEQMPREQATNNKGREANTKKIERIFSQKNESGYVHITTPERYGDIKIEEITGPIYDDEYDEEPEKQNGRDAEEMQNIRDGREADMIENNEYIVLTPSVSEKLEKVRDN